MKRFLQHTLLLIMLLCPIAGYAAPFSPFLDILTWRASEESSSIWASKVTDTSTNQFRFGPEDISFDLNYGFRGGFSYTPNSQFWNATLYWTHFNTQSNENIATALQIIAPEFFSGFTSGNLFFGADIDWHLAMNTLDFVIHHAINLSPSLTIFPSIGVKAGTIFQNIDSIWDAVLYKSTEKVDNDFYGAGPSFGVDAKWNIFDNVFVVGNLHSAFMLGHWNINDVYKRPAVSGVVTATTITTRLNHTMLGTLMLDYFLGLEWQYRKSVTFKLGYEMQYWANQLRLPTFQQLPLHGDLTLHGGTCGIYIDL